MLCFINQRHGKIDILLFNALPHRESAIVFIKAFL